MSISEGASVLGAIMNSRVTPSRVRVSPVVVMVSVGAMRVISPVETVWPSPAPTWPCAPRASAAPYM